MTAKPNHPDSNRSKAERRRRTAGKPRFEEFAGKEGPTNLRIMKLLARVALTRYKVNQQLGHEGGRKYSTIYDRFNALKEGGIIQKVGEVKATTSEDMLELYGLAERGLYIAIFQSKDKTLQANALLQCRKRFSEAWDMFARLYNFPSDESAPVRKWLTSSDGIEAILRHFGYGIMKTDEQLLLTFRRMIDLGIMTKQAQETSVRHWVLWFESISTFSDESEKMVGWEGIRGLKVGLHRMAELAYRHPVLKRVCLAVQEADRPLIDEINRRFMAESFALERQRVAEEIQKEDLG
jgi:hypothetical protein